MKQKKEVPKKKQKWKKNLLSNSIARKTKDSFLYYFFLAFLFIFYFVFLATLWLRNFFFHFCFISETSFSCFLFSFFSPSIYPLKLQQPLGDIFKKLKRVWTHHQSYHHEHEHHHHLHFHHKYCYF